MSGYQNVMMEHLTCLYTIDDETREKIKSCRTYDDLADWVRGDLLCFPSHSANAWHRFRGLMQQVPIRYRVQLMLDVYYTNYRITMSEFYELLADALVRESALEKEARLAQFRDILSPYMQKNGKITVYRGMNANSLKKICRDQLYARSRQSKMVCRAIRLSWFSGSNEQASAAR